MYGQNIIVTYNISSCYDSTATTYIATSTTESSVIDGSSSCDDALAIYWMYIISYCLANTMYFVLMRFADGAVYLVIVLALTAPLQTLFLLFLKAFPINAEPSLCTIWYRCVGVVIIVGGVIGYYLFSQRNESEDQTQNMEGL